MVKVSQIITDAYRESNNIPIGTVPNPDEQTEGLNIFNRLVRSLFGTEAGDPYVNFYIGNNNVNTSTSNNPNSFPGGWFPPVNTRIVCNNTQSQTFYMNPQPQDGERLAINDASNNFATYPVTIKGNGSTINGSPTAVLNTDGVNVEYFYRADLSDWQTISSLTLTSDLPFPVDFEDMFVIGLAMRINPRNGTQIDPQSIAAYKSLTSKFRARYMIRSAPDSEEGLLRTSIIKPYNRRVFIDRFKTGY
jgi:hypothetical protein